MTLKPPIAGIRPVGVLMSPTSYKPHTCGVYHESHSKRTYRARRGSDPDQGIKHRTDNARLAAHGLVPDNAMARRYSPGTEPATVGLVA